MSITYAQNVHLERPFDGGCTFSNVEEQRSDQNSLRAPLVPRQMFRTFTLEHAQIDADAQQLASLMTKTEKQRCLCCNNQKMQRRDYLNLIKYQRLPQIEGYSSKMQTEKMISQLSLNQTQQNANKTEYPALFELDECVIPKDSDLVREAHISWRAIKEIQNKFMHKGLPYYQVLSVKGQKLWIDAPSLNRLNPQLALSFFKRRFNPFDDLEEL